MHSQTNNFEEVKRILNEVDLVDLIAAGAPEDEYDSESYKLLKIFRDTLNQDITESKILAVFEESFSPMKFDEEKIRRLTESLNILFKKNKD